MRKNPSVGEIQMTQKITARFDGKVFHPEQPIPLAANTRVQITVETLQESTPSSFLQTAQSLNLDGPADWATHIDTYLYGVEASNEDSSVS
jgi:hypothetical protein